MNNIIIMLEDMKTDKYDNYCNYLKQDEIQALREWFFHISGKPAKIETIVSFIYELYIFEDIDFRAYDEYTHIVAELSKKYGFNQKDFLIIYQQYKQIIGLSNNNYD